MASQSEMRSNVGALAARWDGLQDRLDIVSRGIEDLEAILSHARERVADLVEARRSAPRESRAAIQAEVRSAKEERDDAAQALSAARLERRAVLVEQRSTQADARSLSRQLRGDMANLLASRERVRGGIASHSVGGVIRVEEQAKRALGFEATQLNALARVAGSRNAVTELEYVYDPPSWYELTPEKLAAGGAHMLEPLHKGAYETLDGTVSVPSETWVLYDSIDTSGMNTQEKALTYAEAVLSAQGHSPVFSLDGPSLPDMPSLKEGRLCISEIKGTDVSGALPSSGLERTFSDGTSLMENSVDWLVRDLGRGRTSVTGTLDALDRAMRDCLDPAARLGLGHLRERYLESARSGFSPLTCDRQVIQVGFQKQGDYLKPPEAFGGKRLDDFVRETANKLVQVNVMLGSTRAAGVTEAQGAKSPTTELGAVLGGVSPVSAPAADPGETPAVVEPTTELGAVLGGASTVSAPASDPGETSAVAEPTADPGANSSASEAGSGDPGENSSARSE